jgi:hypothetical protein
VTGSGETLQVLTFVTVVTMTMVITLGVVLARAEADETRLWPW